MGDGSRSGDVGNLLSLVKEHASDWVGSFVLYQEGTLFLCAYITNVEILPDRLECTATAVTTFGLRGPCSEAWTFGAGWPHFSAGPDYISCPDVRWHVFFRDDWILQIRQLAKEIPADEHVGMRRHQIMEYFRKIRNES